MWCVFKLGGLTPSNFYPISFAVFPLPLEIASNSRTVTLSLQHTKSTVKLKKNRFH